MAGIWIGRMAACGGGGGVEGGGVGWGRGGGGGGGARESERESLGVGGVTSDTLGRAWCLTHPGYRW